MNATGWDLKIAALLSREPGRSELTAEDPLLSAADAAVFALDRPPQLLRAPEDTAWAAPCAIHPLSGQAREMTGFDAEAARAAYIRRVREIEATYADPERRFLALWRLLPEPPPADSAPEPVRRWWRLMPADMRAPAVGLWDHQALMAAVATTTRDGQPQPALLQFNLAGAQDFIAQARRTQDLWAGSYLIGYLAWAALRFLIERYGPDSILQPKLRGEPLVDLWLRSHEIGGLPLPDENAQRIANIPNIFTAIVPADAMCEAGERITEAVRAEWARLAGHVRADFERICALRPEADGAWDRTWRRQVDGFLNGTLFWAALPWPAEKTNREELLARYEPLARRIGRLPKFQEALYQAAQDAPAGVSAGALYDPASRLTARLLQDSKRVRDFAQTHEPGQKCTLSGAHSALHPGGETDTEAAYKSLGLWWDGVRQREEMAGEIRQGDRLSAISLTKRLVQRAHFSRPERSWEPKFDTGSFPSTAGIACAVFLTEAIKAARSYPNVVVAVHRYVTAVEQMLGRERTYRSALLPAWERAIHGMPDRARDLCRLDAEFFYEEAYDRDRLGREYGGEFDPAAVRAARQARDQLVGLLKEKTGCSPSRYYAIVQMDGDKMGEWVGGGRPKGLTLARLIHPTAASHLGEIGGMHPPLGPARHAALSDALGGFALGDARRIVEEEQIGKLIYAGGDDVLALLPLSELLPTLRALYRAFRGMDGSGLEPDTARPPVSHERNSEVFDGFVPGPDGAMQLRMGPFATVSAGVAIVHESTPLGHALDQARQAEKTTAKEELGRDAFAVALLKRSGAPRIVGSKWVVRTQDADLDRSVLDVARLVELSVSLMRRRTAEARAPLSSKLPYTLQAAALEAADGVWPPDPLRAARAAEFRRVARRHLATALSNERREEVRQFLDGYEMLLGGRRIEVEQEGKVAEAPEPPGGVWEEAIGLLTLARMLAGEE